MPELANTIAIVTGAAQGIGECTARTLAADGATLLLADIQDAKVAGVAESLRAEGANVESVHVDIARPDSPAAMVAAALDRFGRVDALVNVAGIDQPHVMGWEMDEAHWREVIDVDLSGPWWCTKAVLPHMIERRSGRVVTITSLAARTGDPTGSPAYAAAKAGLIGLIIGLSQQVEQFGILVNGIAPGATGSTGTVTPEAAKAAYVQAFPLGFGGPQPIADMVRFLLRPSGNWISGAIMNVSGGAWRGM